MWNDGREGNYWSDYNGTDADGDVIGDTPYIVGEDNIDLYPLMNPIAIPGLFNRETPPEDYNNWVSLNNMLFLAAFPIMLALILLGAIIYRKRKNRPTIRSNGRGAEK